MKNRVELIGHLGSAPDVRYTPNNDLIVTISIATTDTWRDKQTQEKRVRTEWHRVVFFKKLAETARDYLTSGMLIEVEGKIRTRKWEKDSQDHYSTEIHATSMLMLKAKSSSSSPAATNEDLPPLQEKDDFADFDDEPNF